MIESTDRRQNWLGVIATVICIGILWALLMPAIQNPRVASRRIACVNNLKNLALASLNFETTTKFYPGYQAQFGRATDGSAKLGSWAVALLPYLEQQQLRDQWDDPTYHEDWVKAVRDGNKGALEFFYPQVALFKCPADTIQKSPYAGTSYAANAGFYLLPRDPVLEMAWYTAAADDSERSTISQRAANGIFVNRLGTEVIDPATGQLVKVFGNSPGVSSKDLVDGASTTILLAESCNNLNWQDFSIVDDSARHKLGVLWLYAGTTSSDGRPKPLVVTSTMKINDGKMYIGSGPTRARPSAQHAQVVNIALADGSTRAISEDIDYHVYQSLMAPLDVQSDIPNLHYKLREDDYVE